MSVRGDVDKSTLLKALAAFWTMLVFLFAIRSINESWESRLVSLVRRVPEAFFGAALCWLMYLVLRRFAPRDIRGQLLWTIGLSIPLGIVFSAANAGLLYVTSPVTTETCGFGQICGAEFAISLAVEYSVNFAFVFLAWGAIYLGMHASAEAVAAERRESTARDQARLAELRALRYQIDPHFLFNCLNSLGTLVDRGDNAAARGMIGEMGSFLRYGLTIDPLADVELDDEIEMQRRYLEIERLRFAHRLLVSITVDPAVRNARIPSLLLQPLVENAIKHGVATTSAPVTIQIRAVPLFDGRMSVIVENDALVPHSPSAPKSGIGLSNVRERLHARFGEMGSLTFGVLPRGGFRSEIIMPLVRS